MRGRLCGDAIPDCAGQVEIARAHVMRVEKNGVLVLRDGRAVMLEGIRLPRARTAMRDQALAALRALAMPMARVTFTATPPKEDRYDRVRVQGFGARLAADGAAGTGPGAGRDRARPQRMRAGSL